MRRLERSRAHSPPWTSAPRDRRKRHPSLEEMQARLAVGAIAVGLGGVAARRWLGGQATSYVLHVYDHCPFCAARRTCRRDDVGDLGACGVRRAHGRDPQCRKGAHAPPVPRRRSRQRCTRGAAMRMGMPSTHVRPVASKRARKTGYTHRANHGTTPIAPTTSQLFTRLALPSVAP